MKISEYIHPMTQFWKVGSIHTVFPYAFNIQVGEQLINVSSHYGYLASDGLYLPKRIFEEVSPYIKRGDFVKVGKEELVFYHQKGIYRLRLKEAVPTLLNVKMFFMKKMNCAS